MTYKILVTDGQNKNTLAVLHFFKSKKVDVISPFPTMFTLATYSKYRGKIYTIKKHNYWAELKKLLVKNKYDFIIPVGLTSYITISQHKEDVLNYTKALVPDWDKMKIAYHKDRTATFAERIGVLVPKTNVIEEISDLNQIDNFPVVIKSSDESGKFVRYANDREELLSKYKELKKSSKTRIILQEYIRGFGCGFYGVCKEGKMYAVFMHKRIKEFPITGGPSAVAESFYSEKLFEYGRKICQNLHWTGPLMAEFKYSSEKEDFYLIELNPKLWGSLDLTISAGVKVPEIIIKLANNEPLPNIRRYGEVNYGYVKYKWVFPDEFKVLLSGGEKLEEFVSWKRENIYTNMDFDDLGSTLFQVFKGFVEGFFILVNMRKKYPHGVIR